MKTITTRPIPGSVEAAPVDGQLQILLEARGTPGVLVVAPPMRLLYVTETAWQLMEHLQEGDASSSKAVGGRAKGVLPSELLDFCRELFRKLASCGHVKDLERFEITRLVQTWKGDVLLRGFLIAESEHRSTRGVVILEQIDREKEILTGLLPTDVGLTEREKSVVQCLARGWTNKEIGAALKLALPTVKEHIRHIMKKTRTTTRTGTLAKLLGI